MHHFNITVTTLTNRYRLSAIAACAADLVDAAIDLFGICAVTVVLA